MNAASSAAAQTITAAASQVPRPLIESPSEMRSVMISADERRDQRDTAQGRRSPAAQRAHEERLHQRERDGEDHDRDDEPRHVDVEAAENERSHDQAHGIRNEQDPRPDDQANHGANIQQSRRVGSGTGLPAKTACG